MAEEKLAEMETWEIQVPGSTWVWIYDRRSQGYDQKRVSGRRGPKRVTLTREEREYNEELAHEDSQHLNPFRNGTLARVVDGEKVDAVTDDDLRVYLSLDGEAAFKEAVEEIDLELTIRRLLNLAAVEGRMFQVEILRDVVDERYRVGGTQPTVEEMYSSGELERTRLS